MSDLSTNLCSFVFSHVGLSKSQAWIAISDSKGDTLIANAVGSSIGNPGNGWKIHISIDPDKISKAALLMAQELNRDDVLSFQVSN